MFGAFERKENDFLELKNIIYIHMIQLLKIIKFAIEV